MIVQVLAPPGLMPAAHGAPLTIMLCTSQGAATIPNPDLPDAPDQGDVAPCAFAGAGHGAPAPAAAAIAAPFSPAPLNAERAAFAPCTPGRGLAAPPPPSHAPPPLLT